MHDGRRTTPDAGVNPLTIPHLALCARWAKNQVSNSTKSTVVSIRPLTLKDDLDLYTWPSFWKKNELWKHCHLQPICIQFSFFFPPFFSSGEVLLGGWLRRPASCAVQSASSCVVNNCFKDLLLLNCLANLYKKSQEWSLGGPLSNS